MSETITVGFDLARDVFQFAGPTAEIELDIVKAVSDSVA